LDEAARAANAVACGFVQAARWVGNLIVADPAFRGIALIAPAVARAATIEYFGVCILGDCESLLWLEQSQLHGTS
jgi:hypothetical protein